jgi:hypothetical protein
MRNDRGEKLVTKSRLVFVVSVILAWVAYRTARNYREHRGWDSIDLVSTALGACFGMLIGVGIFWCKDRAMARDRR